MTDVIPIVVWLAIWGVLAFTATIFLGWFLGNPRGPLGLVTGTVIGSVVAVIALIQTNLHIVALVHALT